MKKLFDICYSTQSKQCLDIYFPNEDIFPVFIYFHGGGLASGDKADQKNIFEYLAATGIAVVSVNYRMYPETQYPNFLNDAAEAVSWVYKNINNYGRISGIFVGGSSAGGYLTQMLCFDKSWLGKYDLSPMDFSGFIHDAGQPTCHFNVLRERKLDSRRVIVDHTAPLYHVGEDESYPPMLIIVSNNDIQNRYEQTLLLVSTLKHFGHTENVQLKIMNGSHCEYVFTVDENGENIFGQLVRQYILGK